MSRGQQSRIGPGRLSLVVGASGSGKDTLLGAARNHFAHQPRISFPRRSITRPPDPSEDHVPMEPAIFRSSERAGAFALCWHAHGLSYGISASIDCDIANGCMVVANVSRSMLPVAKARYEKVSVILVDCPHHIRELRLLARGREAGAIVSSRLQRAVDGFDARKADIVIDNSGSVEQGSRQMISALRSLLAADE